MNEKWKNNFQSKMESHQASEPLGLWDDIEIALNSKKVSPIINYRKVILWTATIGSVAAMLALIFLLGNRDASLLTIPTNIERPTTKQYIEEPTTDKSVNNIIKQTEERRSLLTTNTTSYSKQQIINDKDSEYGAIVEKHNVLEEVETENAEDSKIAVREDANEDANKSDTESVKERELATGNYFPNRGSNYQSTNNYNYRRASKNAPKLIASVYSTNLPNATGQSNGYGELIPRTTLSHQISGSGVGEQNAVDDIIFSNMGEETYTNTEHKQPVKAGLSIRYQLNNKFGVESGLTYAYLSSNLTSGTDKNLYETEQSLQYIGIPLNVSYNIWDNKNWGFYVTAGGLIEKCVAGKSSTDFIVDNKVVSSEDNKIKESPFQFSVNSSIGLQYNLLSKLSIFAEPGLGYYFDNGSAIETIYKEKPLNLNLKLGVRVNIK